MWGLVLCFSYLVEFVDMWFDKGSVEDFAFVCADHNKISHFRRATAQAVMTLKKREGWAKEKKNVLKTSSCYILQTRIYLIKSEANIFIWLLLLNVGWLFHFSAIQTACSGRLHTIDFKVKFDFTLLKVTFVHNLQHGLIKGYASLHSVITFSFVQILKLQKHVTVARIFLSAI